jgi:methylenetetrahydrofolate reductase (NADPH)
MTLPVPISFEFFPPNTPVGDEKLKTVVAELGVVKPEFFSVTYGAGGSTRDKTLATVSAIAALGHEAAPHLSCVGSTRERIAQILQTYRTQNIRRLVALRGDLPSGTGTVGEFRYASELIRFIRETQGADWHIEVACYPEVHPQQRYAKRDLQFFADKVAAGATSAITQFFFNADAYFHFVDEARKLGVTVPIVPGIMPILNCAHRAVRAARWHRDPALGGAQDGRLHGRHRVDPRLRPRRGHPAVPAPDRRRRARHPLLHAEPVAAVVGDLQAAGRELI